MNQIEMRFIRLKTEILSELDHLELLCSELNQIGEINPKTADSLHIRALASILHDFYTGCERIFERVAQEFEGGLPNNPAWHNQLLNEMTLALPTVRPSIITRETAKELQDFLAFRHRFRNIYGFELELEKMIPLLNGLPELKSKFQKEVIEFLERQTEVLMTNGD